MKISLNWLRDYVDIPKNIDPKELAMLFTIRTAEIEGFENQAENLKNIVVGKILEIHPHPDANKLQITKTSIGKETLQIVCGDPGIYVGMYVPVALIGAKVHWHGEKEPVTLKETKIRGVESFGMLCAGEEIGLEEKSEGVFDLQKHRDELQENLEASLGKPLAQILGKDDIIFTVDNKTLTHRPDLWGHYGIAREMAAILKLRLKSQNIHIDLPEKGISPSVEVKAKKLCPRYIGVQIDGITIGKSPTWLKRRLENIGYRSINTIVDVTNYVMAELGQPMHAFDTQKIKEGIVVRLAKPNEKITTLDGIERELTENTLVIADHEKAVAIAGIMGGANSEIDEKTTSILLESANFHPSSVRKTSVEIGLRTEAVQRFEKSLDPNLAHKAMLRACQYILQICPGAKIAGPFSDIKNFEEKKTEVTVNLKKVFSKIGKEISNEEVVDILERLEFKIIENEHNKITIEIPSFRATKDISIEDDIVEEISRLHGYENIEPKFPELPVKLPIENKERKEKHRIRSILANTLGFDEVYNYSFYSLSDIKNALLPEEPHIQVQNYLSEDQTHLRISLLPNMLKNVRHNLKFFDEFKIFEIGRTYEDLQEYFPIEEKKICAIIVKPAKSIKKEKSYDPEIPFYQAKGALETLLKLLKIAGIDSRKGQSFCPYAHPYRYLEYFSKKSDEVIAKVYELHPLVAKNFEVEKANIAAFEINFSKLMQLDRQTHKYKPVPKFPGIEFDVSVVIDKKTEIGTLQESMKKIDKTLIQEVALFDVYEGPNIASDKKALAFKIYLQAADRTLTDEEMKNIQQKIFENFISLGGEIRGLTK